MLSNPVNKNIGLGCSLNQSIALCSYCKTGVPKLSPGGPVFCRTNLPQHSCCEVFNWLIFNSDVFNWGWSLTLQDISPPRASLNPNKCLFVVHWKKTIWFWNYMGKRVWVHPFNNIIHIYLTFNIYHQYAKCNLVHGWSSSYVQFFFSQDIFQEDHWHQVVSLS